MADQCLMLEDQLFVADAVSLRIGLLPLKDSLVVRDGVTRGLGMTMSDSLVVADIYTLRVTALVGDALRISSAASARGHYGAVTSDTLTIRDRLLLTQMAVVEDRLHVSDGLTMRRQQAVGDTLRIADQFLPVRHVSLTVTNRLRLSDRARGSRSFTVGEWLAARDAVRYSRSMTFGGVCTVVDAFNAGRSVSYTVTERARVGDEVTIQAHREQTIADALLLEDLALLPPAGVAWTSNTDTWAASRYLGWPITSLAAIGDQMFGTGPEGLYALDGDDDDGVAIDAMIRTDQRSGGAESSLRHGGYLYAAMSARGPMGARVLANPGAKPASYSYEFEARRNDEIGPMRLKYGRGIKSLMWQFEIFNKDGADFRIAGGLAWVTDPGSRRV